MSSQRPDPRAEVRAIIALILDDARRDPERRPRPQILRWFTELSCSAGIIPKRPNSYRDLLSALIAIQQGMERPIVAGDNLAHLPVARRVEREMVVVDLKRAAG